MEPITDRNIHRLVKGYLTNNAVRGLPNISGWDVSNVTNMNLLFKDYELFNENLSKWDVSKVERMAGMFQNCTNYTGTGLWKWGKKVGNVKNMDMMFLSCENLKDQNLGSWDVSSVEKIEGMFAGCTNYIGYGLDEWGDKIRKLIDTKSMFYACRKLNQNLGSWDVSNINKMYGMFEECTSFIGEGLELWKDKVGKVIDMSSMFSGCPKLKVNISGWVVNPNLVSKDTFKGCTSMPIEYMIGYMEDDEDEEADETIAPKDKCFWSYGPYDIESKKWLKKSGNFIVQVPDIETKSPGSGIILTESENYHCLSLEYLKQVSKIEGKEDKYETFHECSKDVMAKVLAPNGITPLGFGYDDDKKDYNICVSYVKIDAYFVEKPDWFWNGPVPEPRKFKLVKLEGGEKYLVSRSIALYGHNAISGVHCDKSDKHYIYKLAPSVDNTQEKIAEGGGVRKNNKRYIKKSTIRFKKTTNKHIKNGGQTPIKSKLTRKVKPKNKKNNYKKEKEMNG